MFPITEIPVGRLLPEETEDGADICQSTFLIYNTRFAPGTTGTEPVKEDWSKEKFAKQEIRPSGTLLWACTKVIGKRGTKALFDTMSSDRVSVTKV